MVHPVLLDNFVHLLYLIQAVGRGEAPSGNVINLEVYMEAQCPDTTRFIMKQLWPTWQNLSSTKRLQLSLIPFGKARCQPKDGGDFSYTFFPLFHRLLFFYRCQCQHGTTECELNQLMNCVIEQLPQPDLYLSFLHCIQGKANLDDAHRQCIDSQEKLDPQR